MPKKKKQEEIKVRVTGDMKAAVLKAAEAREESESLIVREALAEYLAARNVNSSEAALALVSAEERERATKKATASAPAAGGSRRAVRPSR